MRITHIFLWSLWQFFKEVFFLYLRMEGWLRISLILGRSYSSILIIFLTNWTKLDSKMELIFINLYSICFQLNLTYVYLQQNLEGLPDIIYRQVIPNAKTSSDSFSAGLYRTNPCLILSICCGLINASSPNSTFQ